MIEGTSVSILGTGYYVPKEKETAEWATNRYNLDPKKVERNGFKEVHVARYENLGDMAYKASLKAIENAQIDPLEIDLIIYARAGIPDFFWHPEYARLQHRIGATNAYSYAIDQGCNAQMVGLDIASAKLLTDKRINTVLIISSDMSRLPFVNRWTTAGSLTFGDGASAGIVRCNVDKNKIIKLKFLTDGRFSEMQKLNLGYRMPFVDAIPLEWFTIDFHKLAIQELTPNGEDLREQIKWYQKVMKEGSLQIMNELLEECELEKSDIDFILAYNYNKPALQEFADSLNLPLEKTTWYISEYCGHLGPADIFYNFTRLEEDGKIKKGDKVAVFSAGSGYSWSAGLIEI